MMNEARSRFRDGEVLRVCGFATAACSPTRACE
jgi:hypothetical protein